MPRLDRDKHPLARLVGARLRELRLDAELSQGAFAALVGLPRSVISRDELGVNLPSLETCARYARGLGLDLPSFLVVLDPEWRVGAREASEWVERVRNELGSNPQSAGN